MKKIYTLAFMALVGVASANAQAFKLDKNYVIKTAMKVADDKTVTDAEVDGTEVNTDMLKKITLAYLDADYNTLPVSGEVDKGANYHVLTADYTDPETGISFAAGKYATLNPNKEIKFKDESNPQGLSNIKQVIFYLASQGQLQFYAREYNEDTDASYVNFEGDPTNRKLKSYKAPGFAANDSWTEMSFNKPLKVVVDLTNAEGTEDEMTKASLEINKNSDDTEMVKSLLQFYEQAKDGEKIVQGTNKIEWTADRRFSVAFKKKAYVMGVALISATAGAKTMSFDITGNQTAWEEAGTNGINTINAATAKTDNRIFSIDGKFVGTDASVLSNGIYVKNGQKFVK